MDGLTSVFTFDGVNWLAVIVAAVAAFVIGGVWYNSKGPLGKVWMEEQKFSKKQLKQMESGDSMAGLIALTFAINLAQSLLMVMLINTLGIIDLWEGLLFGVMVGLVWSAGSMAINSAYSFRTLKLYAVDGGYTVTYFMVMAGILAAW